MQTTAADDERQIREIIEHMFEAISWSETSPPDLDAFRHAVRDDAIVLPSARPVVPSTISAFVERMANLRNSGSIRDFQENARTTIVKVFGNLAVAIGGFEAVIDNAASRGVNGFLFVRDEGRWWIAGMAWDNESAATPLPADLA